MILLGILMWLVLTAISWICSCGIVYLVTLCFGWTFSWAWATGIWLILFLLKSEFDGNKK